MEFIEEIFTRIDHPDSLIFIAFCLITFLIGFLTGWGLYGGRVRKLRKENKQIKGELESLAAELNITKEQLELKDADLVKAEREAEEAMQLARTIEGEKAQLNVDLEAAHVEIESLREKNTSYQGSIDDLNNQILGLKTRNSQLTDDIDKESEAMNQLAQMQSSHNATANRLADFEKKLESLVSENKALKKELKTVKTSTEELKSSTEELASSTAELKSSTEELKSSTEEIKANTEELATLATTATAATEIKTAIPAQEEAEEEPEVSGKEQTEAAKAEVKNAIPKAAKDQKDDLTLIKGVGTFIETKLNALGIYTYEQISQFDEALIEKLTVAIEFFPGRIQRDDWVGQAARLMEIKKENPEALDPKAVFPQNSEDLKVIEGIGPKIEQLLKKANIPNWQVLADTPVEKLQSILQEAGDRFRIHDPSTWPMQAQMAADGAWDKLKDYQDFLDGGREKSSK